MSSSDLEGMTSRAVDLLTRLGLPKDARLASLEAFLAGPIVVGVCGTRSRGVDELARGLASAHARVTFRVDLLEGDLERALLDAVVLATPCDAALSARELEVIRSLRSLKRPVVLCVTDAENLGGGRQAGQEEISSLRLRPLLEPEGVAWTFRAKGEAFEQENALVGRMIAPGLPRLHLKPAADMFVRVLDEAQEAFKARCEVRDREREVLRRAEGQGALDLAQFSETEKLERIRVGDRIRKSYEQILVAADATGDALSAWATAGGQGDAKDATATLREAVQAFFKELDAAPIDSVTGLREEGLRLDRRLSDAASALSVSLPPKAGEEELDSVPPAVVEEASQLSATSIQDLLSGAVQMVREAVAKGKAEGDGRPRAQKATSGSGEKEGTIMKTAKAVAAAIPPPLSPAELSRGHLVRGIRSRFDLRVKAYVEHVVAWLAERSSKRAGAWERNWKSGVETIRSELASRHGWTAALGEVQVLRQEAEELRRTQA